MSENTNPDLSKEVWEALKDSGALRPSPVVMVPYTRIFHPRLDDLARASYNVHLTFYSDGDVGIVVEENSATPWVFRSSGRHKGETKKDTFMRLIDEAAGYLLPPCNE